MSIRGSQCGAGQAGRADEALFFVKPDHVPGYAGGAGGVVDFHAGSPPIYVFYRCMDYSTDVLTLELFQCLQ